MCVCGGGEDVCQFMCTVCVIVRYSVCYRLEKTDRRQREKTKRVDK